MAELEGSDNSETHDHDAEPRKFKFKKTVASGGMTAVPAVGSENEDVTDQLDVFTPSHRHKATSSSVATKKKKRETKCIDCRNAIDVKRIREPVVAFPCKHLCHQKCALRINGSLACPQCTEDEDSGDEYDQQDPLAREMLPLPSMDQTLEGPRLRFITRYRVCRALAHDYHEQICVPHNESLATKFHKQKITSVQLRQQWVSSKTFLSFLWSPITIDVLKENRVRVSSLLRNDINFKELFEAKLIVVLNDLTNLKLTLADVTYNKELLSVGMIDTKFSGNIHPVDFTTSPENPFILQMLECMSIPEPKKRLLAAEVQRLNVNIFKELKAVDRNLMPTVRDLFIRSLRFINCEEWQKTLGLTNECLHLLKISPTNLRSLAMDVAPALNFRATRKAHRPYSDDKRVSRRRPAASDDDSTSGDETHGTDDSE